MSDWTAAQDAEGRTYYYNSATQQTSWEAPPGFGAAAAPAPAAAPAADSAWTEVKDASSGKSYYVNSVTNATQWEPPPGFAAPAAAAAAKAPAATGSGAAAGSRGAATAAVKAAPKRAPTSTEPQTVDEKLLARAKKFLAARRQEKARAQPSAYARKRAAGQLAHPGGAPESAAPKGTGGGAAKALPPGWSTAVDPGSGKTYFYNSTSGETAWETPAA